MATKRLSEVESTLLKKIKKARLSDPSGLTLTADKLERQNEMLREAFAKGRQDAAEERMKLDSVTLTYPNVKTKGVMQIPPEPSNDESMTVARAKRIEAQNTKLREAFAKVHKKEVLEKKEREKQYEPITTAIKDLKPPAPSTQQKPITKPQSG
jgi:hypothetical protein